MNKGQKILTGIMLVLFVVAVGGNAGDPAKAGVALSNWPQCHERPENGCLIKRSFDVTPGGLPRAGTFVYDLCLKNTSLFSLTRKLMCAIVSET